MVENSAGAMPHGSWDTWTAAHPHVMARSGDWRALADLADQFNAGALTWGEFTDAIRARDLPGHPRGCGYLLTTLPTPSTSRVYDERVLPKDWVGTFAEVVMLRALLTARQWSDLHAAVHSHPDACRSATAGTERHH